MNSTHSANHRMMLNGYDLPRTQLQPARGAPSFRVGAGGDGPGPARQPPKEQRRLLLPRRGGPDYDYPNFPHELRTFLNPVELQLVGKDQFFAAPGIGPAYDYPNPRGKPFPHELRTWAVSLAVALFASALPPVQQHTPPNPTGKPFPADQRGYVQSSPVQLIGQDRFFGDAGEVPSFDYPNPRGKPHPSDLRTFANPTPLNLLGQDAFFAGAGVGPDYDFPNPSLGKPYPVALRTWTQSPSLFGRDQFFGAPGQGPAYDFPNPTLRKSGASAFAFTPNNNLPLSTVVVAPATTVFDYPNPRGAAFPQDLRTHVAPLAVNLAGKDRFFGAAGQGPVYDHPNPRGRVYPTDLRTWIETSAFIPAASSNGLLLLRRRRALDA
jgi:hypothetical protein